MVDALDLDVLDAAGAHERRLIDLLDCPRRGGGRLAGEHDERNVASRRGRQRGHDLGDARAVGDRRYADASSDMSVRARHLAGTMFMASMNGTNAVPFGQDRCPVHVAVAKEGEMRVHAFRRKGGGKHIEKALLDHADAVSSPGSVCCSRAASPRTAKPLR
jgi:hypothetical protein